MTNFSQLKFVQQRVVKISTDSDVLPGHQLAPAAAELPGQRRQFSPCRTWPGTARPWTGWLGGCTHVVL